GTDANVATLEAEFSLDKTSTAAPDGITIVPALNGGNWLRVEEFNKKWSLQINWFVNSLAGNDENNGSSPQTAVKTAAEVCRRLHQMQAGRNYIVQLLTDVPLFEATPRPFGTVLISDRYRPSFVTEENPEDVQLGGNEQVFNISMNGSRTVI